jgi:hypothetical protein
VKQRNQQKDCADQAHPRYREEKPVQSVSTGFCLSGQEFANPALGRSSQNTIHAEANTWPVLKFDDSSPEFCTRADRHADMLYVSERLFPGTFGRSAMQLN